MVRYTMLATFTLAVAISAVSDMAEASSLRRNTDEAWRLLGSSAETAAPVLPLEEKSFDWIQNGTDSAAFHVTSQSKIAGDKAILIFHDRTVDAATKAETAVVSFDVRSNANCVVSVCGQLTNWIIGKREQCWGLKIAPKSSNQDENGLIRGISAAYTATRPIANKMYLKFDAVNYIDGSVCEYEVLSGTKTVTTEAAVVERA